MASDDICAVHSWAVAVVCPPMKGGGHLLLVRRRRRLSSLFGGGGGGGGFMANQRLLATAPTSVLGSGRGTFQVLSGGVLLCAQTCVGGVSTFSPLERATLSWNICGFRLAFACQKEVPRRLVV
jgi:hypothetical protein